MLAWNLIGDDPLLPLRNDEGNGVKLSVSFMPCFNHIVVISVKHESDMKLGEITYKCADKSAKTFIHPNKMMHISLPSFILLEGEYIETIRYLRLHTFELAAI